MKTVIVYLSQHHGNTKKLLDAIKEKYPSVRLVDVTLSQVEDLNAYGVIGVASGIYFSTFHRTMLEYLSKNLPSGKKVFALYTCGAMVKGYARDVRAFAEKRECEWLGEYGCLGFDTFGPLKAVGGIAKGHPTQEEVEAAVAFYERIEGEGR